MLVYSLIFLEEHLEVSEDQNDEAKNDEAKNVDKEKIGNFFFFLSPVLEVFSLKIVSVKCSFY